MSLAPTRCDVLQALVHERVVLCELAVGEHCCEDNALHRSSARTSSTFCLSLRCCDEKLSSAVSKFRF